MMKSENTLLENASQPAHIISKSSQGHKWDDFHFLIKAKIKLSIEVEERRTQPTNSCLCSNRLPRQGQS